MDKEGRKRRESAVHVCVEEDSGEDASDHYDAIQHGLDRSGIPRCSLGAQYYSCSLREDVLAKSENLTKFPSSTMNQRSGEPRAKWSAVFARLVVSDLLTHTSQAITVQADGAPETAMISCQISPS